MHNRFESWLTSWQPINRSTLDKAFLLNIEKDHSAFKGSSEVFNLDWLIVRKWIKKLIELLLLNRCYFRQLKIFLLLSFFLINFEEEYQLFDIYCSMYSGIRFMMNRKWNCFHLIFEKQANHTFILLILFEDSWSLILSKRIESLIILTESNILDKLNQCCYYIL